jgi:uncharacterized protein YqeY
MIFEQIKKDRMQAMKDRDEVKKNLLSVIISDTVNKASNDPKNPHKEPTDVEMAKAIEKYIAGNEEILTYISDRSKINSILLEKKILKAYLPQKMSSEEVRSEIKNFVALDSDNVNIGKIMKHLKDNYGGQYDGSEASKIANEEMLK